MSEKSTNPRWLALKSIMLVVQRGRSLDDALQVVLGNSGQIDERDISLCRALTYGICRWYFSLQAVIDGYLRKPFKKKDKDLGHHIYHNNNSISHSLQLYIKLKTGAITGTE